ncbi:FG-GAP-like repeat-containing protein [Neolewinella persica]|uniref:FG-GAP-like repeat-containing protein n=1 Tax=Neolewinella persica TaxID=70998 RepID=UPI00039C4A11|nr:FG-GAP-like repeat-containing protein [Neolewinella persica]
MRNLLFFVFSFFLSAALSAQPMFSNQSGLLSTGNTHSGVAMAVVDVNKDGLDDIIRIGDGRNIRIEFQHVGGSFSAYLFPTALSTRTWGITVADVDGNGVRDIAVGGTNNSTEIWFAEDPLNPLGFSSTPLPEVFFLQGANFIDINNDGLVEFFACDDVDISKPYRYSGGQSMTYDLNLLSAYSTVPSDNSGNYASVWTDYDDDGDLDMYLSKCKLGVGDPTDGRRLNQLFRNNGDGSFTDVAEAAGLLPLAQSWSADFADIDNDGDMDCFVVNHDKSGALYRNDGNNVFTDVTVATGIAASLPVTSSGIQCNFEDFNNDGWIDLLLTHGQGIPLIIYQNNAGTGMVQLIGSQLIGPLNEQAPQSVATGDLNNDGYIDFYGGYASGYNLPSTSEPDVMMINTRSGANHLKFRLQGVASNFDAIGTKIKVYDSDFGVQVREVRSGEGYGIMNSLTQHFGLGATTMVDSVVIRWPSGLTEIAFNVLANQTLAVEEGSFDQSLPLEWQSFTAITAGKEVQLDWSTSQERGTSHFIIERSTNLTHWTEAGREAARNESGAQAYLAFDESPLPGTSYYRLRQVDVDGAFTYSSIATVSFAVAAFEIFPNPAGEWVNVRNESSAALYSIESIDGRVLSQPEVARGNRLSLLGLAPGVYLIRSGGEARKLVVR